MAIVFATYTKDKLDTDFVKKPDFPTGKNLTDTVTFQDLVDLGLIKAPTS